MTPHAIERARCVMLAVSLCASAALSTAGAQGQQSSRSLPADSARISMALISVPLQTALEQLVEVSGMNLSVYDTRVLRGGENGPPRISCRVDRAPPERMLACIVNQAGLDYYRMSSGTYVVIARAEDVPAYATLSGVVIDGTSGTPLPQARIVLAERPDQRVANDAGSFTFGRLAPGKYRLNIQAIGYEPFQVELAIPPDGRLRERFSLKRYAVMTTPIVVNGLQPGTASSTLGGIALAGAVATPLVLGPGLYMPGAPSALGLTRRDGLGDLHIQGGESGEHVWRLDGVPIFDAATLAGVFGAFSPLAIEELRVRRAGYETRAGSFTAGVIDLSHGYGDATVTTPVQSAAQADPFSASTRVVVPVAFRATRVTTMVSARTGLWDVFQPTPLARAIRDWNLPDPVLLSRLTGIGRTITSDLPTGSRPYEIESGSTDVRLRDYHLATRAEIGAFQRLSASLYVGQHGVSTVTEARPEGSALQQGGVAIIDVPEQPSTRATDSYGWRTVAGQIKHEQLHGTRVTHTVQLRGSEHRLDHDFSMVIGASPLLQDPPRRDGNRIREFALVGGLQVAGSAAWDLDVGSEVVRTDALLDLRNGVLRSLGSEVEAWRVASHAEVKRRLGNRYWLDGGVRLTHLPGTNSTFAEPRIALRADGESIMLGPWAWRVGAGVYRQFVNQFDVATSNPTALVPSVRFWLPTDGADGASTAYHFTGEGVITPLGRWQLRGEWYAKWQPLIKAFDYAVLLNRDPGQSTMVPPSTYVANVSGYAYGAGLRASREGYMGRTGWSDRTTGLPMRIEAGYDYGVSRRSFPSRFGGERQPTPWNEPHRALISVEARPGGGFVVAARSRGTWGRTWGLRQSYYDLLTLGNLGAGLPITAPEDASRPAILETDIGITWTTRVGPWTAEIGAAVQNVFDRRNVLDYSLAQTGALAGSAEYTLAPRYLPGALPSLSFRVIP